MTSTTNNLALTEPSNGTYVNTWDVPVNNNTTILDQIFGNTTNVSVNTSSTPSFTAISAPSTTAAGGTSQAMRFLLSGALAANQTVLLPQYNSSNVAGMWVVTNATTGAFTVTIGMSNTGGTAAIGNTITVPQNFNTLIYSDGSTGVYKADDGLVQFPIPVTLGGTGLATLTANNVMLGNGTSAPTFVPPTTNGNVLTASFTPISVFNGSISGTTLTVASITSGTIAAGQTLTGTGVTAGTTIVSGSGLSWLVSASQTVSSTTITGSVLTWTSSTPASPSSTSGRLIRSPQVLTSGTSYTTPAGCNSIYVQAVGGGGGSAGLTATNCASGGGGGGGMAAKYFSVSPSTAYTYAIGAAGSGGASGNNAGSAGGSTTFTVGGTTITGGGGSGSTGSSSNSAGAAGGSGTNGDLNINGNSGGSSATAPGTAYVGGVGGGSFFGGGAPGGLIVSGAAAGTAATSYGGGGGGSAAAGATAAGASGYHGVIVIWEYT